MISPQQRHQLLMAERSRNVNKIREAIFDVLGPDVSALDIEMVFRAAGSPVFLIADGDVIEIRIGHDQMSGTDKAANRKALAGLK